MSQLSSSSSSSSFDGALLVRDAHGHCAPASADQILDAARCVIDQQMPRGVSFAQPEMVKNYLCTKLAGIEHEVFVVLFTGPGQRLIEYDEMFRGTVNTTSVYPREVAKKALKLNATGVILAHTHPSGCVEPSRADELLTQTLRDALALIEVRVLDHVIVAGNTTASFAQRGLL
jgi:DNA repair protein RadC